MSEIAETELLLSTLAETANAPLEEATALHPRLYRSEEIHELELKNIFAKDWLCPGRAADIPNAGDYLTYSIGDQPIFIQRGKDGEIKAFANVCRHRMMKLLDGAGTCKRIVCPYHAWTYDLDGKLIGAPHMDKTKGFEKSTIALEPVRAEVWCGWIYVTMNPEAPPINELLADVPDFLDLYKMEAYVPVVMQDHLWQTNWKLLTENFIEGYHLPVAHKATVGAGYPADAIDFPESQSDWFSYELFKKPAEAVVGNAHPNNKRLTGEWRNTSVLGIVFPAHLIVLAPDHLWYLSLRPKGVGEVHVRFGAALAPEVHAAQNDPEVERDKMIALFDQVNEEDRFVVEGIFKGSGAPLTKPGPLSWLEHQLHDFAQYLHRKIGNGTAS